MLCISLETTDPCFNLAVDEYLLKEGSEEFLVLGINDPSVIIGKHQIAHMETSARFLKEHNIPVIRRISGGGAVYHDRGNLNFSFILNSEPGKQVNFRKYTGPVLEFLSSIGINASFEGKSDLKFNGFKISGNAEHVYHNRVLHHGTLLFDTDLNQLESSLRNDKSRYHSKAVKSNPAKVINLKYVLKYVLKDILKDILKYIDNTEDLKTVMMKWLLENLSGSVLRQLKGEETRQIELLAETKYRTWDWNYAYGPEYLFENRNLIEGKDIYLSLSVKDGIIQDCRVEGSQDLAVLFKRVSGCRHMVEDIQQATGKENLKKIGLDIFDLF
jgi:lipoate-protein ligase A